VPTPVATLLAAVIIGWLLHNEQKHAKGVSKASWLPTLWLLYYATKPIGRWLDPQGDIESGSAVDQLFMLGLIFMGCRVISKRKLNWKAEVKRSKWLMLLLAYMLASSIWSDAPMTSIKQWCRMFGSAIMALVVMTEEDPNRALQSLFLRTTYVLIPLSAILVKYIPNQGIEYRSWNGEKFYVGACLQKNGLGRLCLICAVFLVWMLIRRWKGRERITWKYQTLVEILILVIIGWLLKGPGNNYPMTAVAVLVISCGVLFALMTLKREIANRLHSAMAVVTLVVALALMFFSVSGMIPSMGTQTMGRDGTFTGRTDIWDGVRKVAFDNALVGVGYNGYWYKPHEFPNVPGAVNEGHNGYLDVFVETGFVGLGLLVIVLASYVFRAKRTNAFDYDWACFRVGFMLMMILHNFTETSLLRSSAHFWALFIFMYVVYPEARGHPAKIPKPGTAPGPAPRPVSGAEPSMGAA
jgi:exopolysaccharide production protein ExoQ